MSIKWKKYNKMTILSRRVKGTVEICWLTNKLLTCQVQFPILPLLPPLTIKFDDKLMGK